MNETDDSEAAFWAEYERLPMADPPLARTFNHGGPGVCTLCYPKGVTVKLRTTCESQPILQGELLI